jgi:hypothetical protein
VFALLFLKAFAHRKPIKQQGHEVSECFLVAIGFLRATSCPLVNFWV